MDPIRLVIDYKGSPIHLSRFPAMNWFFPSEIIQYISDNLSDLENLDNISYWQHQMTEEEWEMKRHPNRGPRWYPNRLREIRDTHERKVMSVFGPVLGHENYSDDNVCLKCSIGQQQWGELYLQEWNDRLPEGTTYMGIPWARYYNWCKHCYETAEAKMQTLIALVSAQKPSED